MVNSVGCSEGNDVGRGWWSLHGELKKSGGRNGTDFFVSSCCASKAAGVRSASQVIGAMWLATMKRDWSFFFFALRSSRQVCFVINFMSFYKWAYVSTGFVGPCQNKFSSHSVFFFISATSALLFFVSSAPCLNPQECIWIWRRGGG